jgi:hypothetical protein
MINLFGVPGTRFGSLVAIRRIENNKHGHPIFLCKCDCGAEAKVAKAELVRRDRPTRSCGCARSHGRKKSWTRSKYGLFRVAALALNIDPHHPAVLKATKAKHTALSKNREWGLSAEEAIKLCLSPCHYCGLNKPGVIGIDRVDSSITYIPNNVVPACKRCNAAKNDMTTEEFKEWLIRLYQHYVLQKS